MLYDLLQNKTYQAISCVTSLLMWFGSALIAAIKKNPICLFLMIAAHTTQSAVIGIKTGRRAGQDTLTSLAQCLCYGFAWWLPLLLKQKKEG